VKEALRIAVVGGANGIGQVEAGLLQSGIPGLCTTAIVGSFDDDDKADQSSNGQLRRRGRPGYYSDATWVLGKMRAALFGDNDWLLKIVETRFRDGIHAEPFGNLLASFFGPAVERYMDHPDYRESTIDSIRKIIKVPTVEDKDVEELLSKLFDHALEEDDFGRHSFRNISLVELEETARDLNMNSSKALEGLHYLYRIPKEHRVVPATWKSGVMKVATELGRVVESQRLIDFPDRDPLFDVTDKIDIGTLRIDPPVSPSTESILAFLDADVVMLSCGSIPGNLAAAFSLEKGLKQALQHRMSRKPSPPIIYVMNFMTEKGITRFEEPYDAADVVNMIEEIIGQRLSCIIYDDGRKLPASVIKQHLPEQWIQLGKLETRSGRLRSKRGAFVVKRDLAMALSNETDRGGPPKILHDPRKLASVFEEIIPKYAGIEAVALL
jgi:2-phospho-L-lactate transferase/gluconeogenesis factor (CofD/UPF0052 family)